MKGDTPKSRKFLNHIRMVNSAFQMTSFRANQIKLGFGSYKVQGQVYHTMGPLKNSPGQDAKFVQIYFMDNSDEETERRCEIFPEVDKELISELQKLLHANNSLIQKFKMALEMDDSFASAKVVIRAEKCPRGEHKGRFNAPSSNEIAVIISDQQAKNRDIVIKLRSSDPKDLICIDQGHKSYDALQYPIIFWNGQDSFDLEKKIEIAQKIKESLKISKNIVALQI